MAKEYRKCMHNLQSSKYVYVTTILTYGKCGYIKLEIRLLFMFGFSPAIHCENIADLQQKPQFC